MYKIGIVLIGFFLMVGCSAPTKVVLLDNGKAHNAVVVSTNKGSAKLDSVGKFVSLKDKDTPPSPPKVMPKEEIEKQFGDLLAVIPKKPVSYILYFEPHSTRLTPESEQELKKALETIKKRQPCMVDIIGHTDTVGSNEINIKVSLKRAKYIKSLIEKEQLGKVEISAKGYGEEDLLVSTPDNTDEAKNRNVEIFIK